MVDLLRHLNHSGFCNDRSPRRLARRTDMRSVGSEARKRLPMESLMPNHRLQSGSEVRAWPDPDEPHARSVWRRRYTLGLILFLLLPGVISAPITLVLLRRWLRCFHRWQWRRQLCAMQTDRQPIRRLQQGPAYALMKVRHQALATACHLLLALVPARVVVGMLRGTQADGETLLVICMAAQMAEVMLIAVVMFSFLRAVCRRLERLVARQAAGGAR